MVESAEPVSKTENSVSGVNEAKITDAAIRQTRQTASSIYWWLIPTEDCTNHRGRISFSTMHLYSPPEPQFMRRRQKPSARKRQHLENHLLVRAPECDLGRFFLRVSGQFVCGWGRGGQCEGWFQCNYEHGVGTVASIVIDACTVFVLNKLIISSFSFRNILNN